MTRALCALLACVALAACGPERVAVDRCDGLSLEFLWRSADRTAASYYEVDVDGAFRSSGGQNAVLRTTSYDARLDDRETARFVTLVRAIDWREDSRASDDAPAERSEVTVRDRGVRRSLKCDGREPSLDALRAFLSEIALRQYRDTIDAQPEAQTQTGSRQGG
ncbi:MAG: hypothetical protein LW636_09060 [Planctomycetaceae bacterium]|nr:hypothetical protein [Planctomycetaceae bacterium]